MQAKQIKIAEAQAEILEWSQRNFGTFVDVQKFINLSSFLGMVEELGELAHAILKQAQGIRGTKEEHDEAIDDAIADLMVFTLDFAGRNNKDLEGIFNRVWAKVKERDWKKNAQSGDVTLEQVVGPELAAQERASEEKFIAEHPNAKIVNVGAPPKSYSVPVIRDLPAEEGEKD